MTQTSTSAGPLVSIVTPTLNQAAFIEATLRSVMRQKYPRIQHIVVDGGSTDGTQEILTPYQGRYNLTWTSGADGGMYEAINRGMASAGGDVLCYLNSDDLFTDDLLAEARHVRSRYERAGAASARLSGIGERARGWLWRRRYWAKFLQARADSRQAHGWAGFLRAADPKVSLLRVLLVQVPLLGWRFASDAVVPSPGWIDELTGRDDSN